MNSLSFTQKGWTKHQKQLTSTYIKLNKWEQLKQTSFNFHDKQYVDVLAVT